MILKSEITQLVPPNVKLGFYLLDTKTKEQIVINENDWFPLASVSKLITAIFALAKNINIKKEDIFNVISRHCDSSYKRLLEEISSEEINSQLAKLNIEIKVDNDNKDKVNNLGTPNGIHTILSLLLEGELLESSSKHLVIKSLEQQNDEDGFKLNKHSNWYHMTGGLEGVCNDIGYLEFEDRKIIIIGLIETTDTDTEWYHLEETLQKIGKIIMSNY
ncbi:serine hydrolase [Bacillus paramycoides]|uniref:serine hydrolase n=1 Tax=Bacillus paramycoides TaxID=2026194 RepID=UPI002E1D5CE5|nr:serine hydrolase [Bacillus paramycoides]MED1412640.1 serine hydrolase [Bacillus paramycoides]MED1462232.1 serine hydrolase [Bacillus paramycoides]MED1494481.1 serine hydrolase [Bacillus paramycoides]